MSIENKYITWEESINIIRKDPQYEELVLKAYLLTDIYANANNFYNSEEWIETKKILKHYQISSGTVLDMGAGNGIASYSFSKEGFKVISLEPDKSDSVGNGAIKKIKNKFNLDITINESKGESLDIENNSIDFIYARQMLHHSVDLFKMLSEIARVLKPNGYFLAVREPVISHKDDLQEFLESHPLHKYFGGENAFLLTEYLQAIKQSNLKLIKTLGPADTVINHFPTSNKEWDKKIQDYYSEKYGSAIGSFLARRSLVKKYYNHKHNKRNNYPGRLYSFLTRKI